MPENKMVDVLIDIHLAQAIYTRNPQFSTSDKRDELVAGVLKKHKVTQAELDSSLMWYSENIEYYETINDSVASKLKARNERFLALSNKAVRKRNTDHLIPSYYNLNSITPVMRIDIDSFRVKNLDMPKFRLQFDVQGLSDLQNVEAALFFKYKDTLVKEIVPITENTRYTIDKPLLPDSLLKGISGYVHARDKAPMLPLNVMLYNVTYLDSLATDSSRIESMQLKEMQNKEIPVKAIPNKPSVMSREDRVKKLEKIDPSEKLK